MSTHSNGLKKMKCATCPEILQVDGAAISCQCGDCALHRALPPHQGERHESDGEQLELGEVAS